MKTLNGDHRTPVIRCDCGHSIKMHEDPKYGLTPCRRHDCDCTGWDWSPGYSDAEFAPIPDALVNPNPLT